MHCILCIVHMCSVLLVVVQCSVLRLCWESFQILPLCSSIELNATLLPFHNPIIESSLAAMSILLTWELHDVNLWPGSAFYVCQQTLKAKGRRPSKIERLYQSFGVWVQWSYISVHLLFPFGDSFHRSIKYFQFFGKVGYIAVLLCTPSMTVNKWAKAPFRIYFLHFTQSEVFKI